jgi:hypothetical protein
MFLFIFSHLAISDYLSNTSIKSFLRNGHNELFRCQRRQNSKALYVTCKVKIQKMSDTFRPKVLRSGCRNLYFFPQYNFKMHMKLKPSLEEVQEFVSSGAGNTIPIYAELHADMLTPVSAYLKVSDRSKYSFLLESVAGGETIGRYSFIGSGI